MIRANQIVLVTGPARSGKSEWAEQLAVDSGRSVVYVATAQENTNDPEWQTRIAQHRLRRPDSWQTLAVPSELATTIQNADQQSCLLVDSLGTWLANLLDQDDESWEITLETILLSLKNTKSDVILVAEETGWGVVPAYPMGRTFRDRLGKLIREVGAIADQTFLVTGGHVLNLGQLGTPLNPMLLMRESNN